MKSLIARAQLRSSAVVLVLVAGALACGVVEHPHDVKAIDTSNDFGPLGGSATTISSGAGGRPGSGGTPATGGTLATGGTGSSAAGRGGSGAQGGVPGMTAGSAGTPVSTSGGAPNSGVTITLGGVNVPKEKAIAFIHIGHSNMAGQASSPSSSRAYHYTETNPHAFMYKVGSSPTLVKEPSAGGPGAGPGTALMKEAVAMAPDYYFISLGHGEPSAYCSQFVPGALYYDALIAGPKAIKGRVTFGGIFIYLGITERHGSSADVNGFPNCINTLVSAIRKDVGEPNLPALMNDYEVESRGEFVINGAVYNAIYPQIQKTPSVVSNFALVSAATIAMQDDHHFNLDGQRTWAQRALKTMKDKGWFLWAP
ncbi:MAG TPA: sialate O-acetylesterase [Polyangiaceae bacterium]|nr:sialate O-acetylesterase [Polyangiaceae bacterium]